jgi:hypothetical protein
MSKLFLWSGYCPSPVRMASRRPPFPLLRLPPEVRRLIYALLFTGVTRHIRNPAGSGSKRAPSNHLTAILKSCRKCRKEATPVLYSTVVFHPADSLSLLRLKYQMAGPANYPRIRILVMDFQDLRAFKSQLSLLKGLRHLIPIYELVRLGHIGQYDCGTASGLMEARHSRPFQIRLHNTARKLWRRFFFQESNQVVDRTFKVTFRLMVLAADTMDKFEV